MLGQLQGCLSTCSTWTRLIPAVGRALCGGCPALAGCAVAVVAALRLWWRCGRRRSLQNHRCEVLTGFFCEHAFEMARTEKESLIQDVVGPIVLGQCGSTLEIENRLAQAAGLWQIVMRLG